MKDQEALIGRVGTPGPWHVEPVTGEDEEQFWSDDWNGKVWCVCHPQTSCNATCVVDWINEGDAHLIAAAPDMLAALNAVVATSPIEDSVLPLVLDAIAKATGTRLRTDLAS
jgi:hypothetical protein